MGIEFETDIFETIAMRTGETGVYPTAAAMLRDVVHPMRA
jgi:homoserine dehydrogenase